MTTTDPTPDALAALLSRGADVARADGDLRARLQWLEDTAAAIEGADLGDAADTAARDLRAALGAVVAFSRSDRSEKSLVELQLVHKTLIARALLGITRALAASYRTLAQEKHAHRAACLDVATAYDAIAKAIHAGQPWPAAALEKLRDVDAQLRRR